MSQGSLEALASTLAPDQHGWAEVSESLSDRVWTYNASIDSCNSVFDLSWRLFWKAVECLAGGASWRTWDAWGGGCWELEVTGF